MLLPTKSMKLLYLLIGLFVSAICIVAYAARAGEKSLLEGIVFESLLRSYVDDGCTIEVIIGGSSENPELHGPFRILHQNGACVVQGRFESGQLHGDLKTFDLNGRLLSLARYRRGKIEGQRLEWGDAGWISLITPYDDNGEKHGTERYFERDRTRLEIDWEHGTSIEVRIFGENGEVERRLRDQAMRDWFRKMLEASLQN